MQKSRPEWTAASSGSVVKLYSPMTANLLMKQNVSTLLRQRKLSQKDLAMYCHRKESWISKILTVPSREFPMKYWDKIADFLGVSTYQLLQPGMSNLTERRAGVDRRSVKDRRIAPGQRAMLAATVEVDAHHPRRKGPHHGTTPGTTEQIARLVSDFESRLTRLLSTEAQSGKQAPTARRKVAGAHPRDRNPGGSDARKD